MIALVRKPGFSLAAACLAGLTVFAGYCSLHALATDVRLSWTVPITWGMLVGVPAAGLLAATWRFRRWRPLAQRPVASALLLFLAATIWGILVRANFGAGGMPRIGDIAAHAFIVIPATAGLAIAAALILMRERPPVRPAPVLPWIPVPEEPLLRLRSDQVSWISSAGNYCELHTADRNYLVRVPLTQMAERLKDHGFVRVHRSSLVNLGAVVTIERGCSTGRPMARLHCGAIVAIGRRFQAGVLAATDGRLSHP